MGQGIATRSKAAASGSKALSLKARSGFLNHLAATGSVDAAADAAEIAPIQAYAACRTDAAFAEAWRAALRVGYDRLEAMLIERTAAVLAGETSGPLETPDVLFALRLIERQREAEGLPAKRTTGGGGADKTDAAILKRLAMLSKRHAAEEARARAAQEGGGA